jgi:HEAT repeat protein
LQKAYGQAAKVLIALLKDEDPRVQLRATDLLMGRADRWTETEVLESRIAALEQQAALNNKNNHYRR